MGRYQRLIKETVVPFQEAILNDQIEGIAKSHAVANFRLAAEYQKTGKCSGQFYGMVFQDSDVAKWIEAVAYTLIRFPDTLLENRCDALIKIIEESQYPNGYLNTYFTIVAPELKWTNLGEAHELYCAGHMIEAAVAYYEATGKRTLLEVVCRLADHIYDVFITQRKAGYPGHPEIELALMRLYRTTGNIRYKELSQHFIDVRGVDSEYFQKEAEQRGWHVWSEDAPHKEYAQNHLPVREQDKAVGHAVRAMYLYTAMAAQASLSKEQELTEACRRIWKNITSARMYVTGAIGSGYEGEAFTKDYHLPSDTAYAETCAAIGFIFFARQMLEIEKKAHYADVMERVLYNGVLSGMQLDGKRFFYVNPLEVVPGISGDAVTHHHALPQRPEWFACACCPPNVARLLTSLSDYAWIEADNTLYANLFIGGLFKLSPEDSSQEASESYIEVQTQYPYEGGVNYYFHTTNAIHMSLALRIPDWSFETRLFYNGEAIEYVTQEGYAILTKSFTEGDVVKLELDMRVRKIHSNSKVSANSGKIAIMRGPLIYCIEGVDHDNDVLSLMIDSSAEPTVGAFDPQVLDGITRITMAGFRMEKIESLYSFEAPRRTLVTINLTPYYAWGNRGLTQMRVWIPEAL